MKTSLLSSVLATACSACLAQSTGSSVELYGIADAGVVRTTGLAGGTDDQVVSGIMQGSRWGLRGNEDLGGGYRAVYTLESRVELNNGTMSNRPPSGTQLPDRLSNAALLGLPAPLQPAVTAVAASIGSAVGVNLNAATFDRQVFVGLVTPVGAVLLGRQYTPAYETHAAFDALETQSSLSAGQVAPVPAALDIRQSNAVAYRIQQGPVTAGLMYTLPGRGPTGSSSANRLAGVFGIYRGSAFAFGAGYNARNNELGEKSLKSFIVGASADIGPGKLTGQVGFIKDDHPTNLSTIATTLTPVVGAPAAGLVQNAFIQALKQDGRLYHIGYRYLTGPFTLYVAYSTYDDRQPKDADVASYGAALTYSLSKRTDLNVVLTHFDNKNLAQAAPGQAGYLGGFTASAGTDSNSLALGMRHRF